MLPNFYFVSFNALKRIEKKWKGQLGDDGLPGFNCNMTHWAPTRVQPILFNAYLDDQSLRAYDQ